MSDFAEDSRLPESRGVLCAPLNALPEMAELCEGLSGGSGPFAVHELSDAQKAHFAAALEYGARRRVVFIAHNEYAAQKVYEDLYALYENDALFMPYREVMFYDVEAKDYGVSHRRASALDRLSSGNYKIAVMGVDAAVQFVTPPELFNSMTFCLKAGGRVDLEGLINDLSEMGYERVSTVEARGAFAVRGGILDVYPVDHVYASRIELFDDEIDSIRPFDVGTQRTLHAYPADGEPRSGAAGPETSDGRRSEGASALRIIPARDVLFAGGELPDIIARIQSAAGEKITGAVEADLEKLKHARYFAGMDRYLAYIYEGGYTPVSYTRDCVYILDEPSRAFLKLQASAEEHSQICMALAERGKLLPGASRVSFDFHELVGAIPPERRLSLSAMNTSRDGELLGPQKHRVITGRPTAAYQGNVELLKTDIRERLEGKWTAILLTKSAVKADRLRESLRADNIPVQIIGSLSQNMDERISVDDEPGVINARSAINAAPGILNICYGALSSGFEYPKIKLAVIGDNEFSGGARRARRPEKTTQGERISFFTDLKTGDFIVHQTHGIGLFSGIEQMKIDGVTRDFLKIKYKDNDILYIPTNQLDLVQKYIGSDARSPKINSLNSTEWARTKRRVKESLKTLAAELILIYAKRREARGFAFSPDTVWQRQFEEQFPYPETDDQLRSVEEIKADMESARLMDRLLCGDVGFGKTEVAVRAAFKAVTDGKQVAFLVPTTVLAQQHHQTFTDRFRDFPVSVDVLSRFRTAKEQKHITESLKNGMLDIVIGTHKLLNKNIDFKNLGLLVVDEEQRFGVSQKERIKAIKPDVDVLSLSATPIPRTLHMSMTKIRDISILKDPPEERFPVQTFVMEYDGDVIREAILREVARSGQVFYLYNRVMGIDIKAMQLRGMLPESVRIAYAHGQMNDRELEDIMLAFVDRQYDVLICTTIIESGLDIPNVNTIVVEDADHMGLAQLYQLRGRVGRSNRLAYAYITHRRDKIITEESEKRLAAIREFTELGSGFKIAMRDMEIRGVGNLLGAEQHGHMESVGYDMYCRLLDEAVREMEKAGGGDRGGSVAGSGAGTGINAEDGVDTAAQVTLDLRINAYIDSLYIEDEALRLEMYQKIAAARTEDDIGDITDEMRDRYSTPPPETENLVGLARIKILAARCGITSISDKNGRLALQINPGGVFDMNKLSYASKIHKGRVLFNAGAAPHIIYMPQEIGRPQMIGNPRAGGGPGSGGGPHAGVVNTAARRGGADDLLDDITKFLSDLCL